MRIHVTHTSVGVGTFHTNWWNQSPTLGVNCRGPGHTCANDQAKNEPRHMYALSLLQYWLPALIPYAPNLLQYWLLNFVALTGDKCLGDLVIVGTAFVYGHCVPRVYDHLHCVKFSCAEFSRAGCEYRNYKIKCN